MHVMTPHAHRELKRSIRWHFAELRKDIEQARRLRATGKVFDGEEAEGLLVMGWHTHNKVRDMLKTYRTARVVKYSNIGPAAAARLFVSR